MNDNIENLDPLSRRELMAVAGGLAATALSDSVPLLGAEEDTKNERGKALRSIPLQVFCGTGDHLWARHHEPVDSPATINAMLEWMSETYGISRLYWRGGQSLMWTEHFHFGPENLLAYDWTAWKYHLYHDLKINEAAVSAAKANDMEIFLYTGLFEFGVQPDIGVVGPYPFEDEIRREHPEWCSVDRWGERRCPGPISFCYPEAREKIVQRYVENVERFGYDGMCFYTYVENCGILYEDEFGFNQPIVEKFLEKYPDTDLRTNTLTEEQKEYWYACRGEFVTQFLRELHLEFSKRGKKLSVILDAKDPDYVQPWWSQPISGTGKIKMDWRQWVRDGIVDEIWVQLAPSRNQYETLDLLRDECRQYGVKLTVRAVDPFHEGWKPYIKSGVTPVAVITWKRNGIEPITHQQIDQDSLDSPHWKTRLQAQTEVESGRLKIASERVAKLAKDPHVLVRRRTMYALASLKSTSHVSVIEDGMFDDESSVRIAATGALAVVHRPESAKRILEAVAQDGYFQMKLAAVEALSAMKERSLPFLLTGAKSSNYAVREVSVRSLYSLGKVGFIMAVSPALLESMENSEEDERVRCHALKGVVGLRLEINSKDRQGILHRLIKLSSADQSTQVQLKAAWGLGYFYVLMQEADREKIVNCLAEHFKKYGDNCERTDAAYGWRLVGNSLLMCHERGRKRLESMRTQKTDKWLAWLAYEVIYLPHRQMKMSLIDESEAIDRHEKYAPPFPGYRRKSQEIAGTGPENRTHF